MCNLVNCSAEINVFSLLNYRYLGDKRSKLCLVLRGQPLILMYQSIKMFENLTLMSLSFLCFSILSSVPASEEVQMLLTVIAANEVGAISQAPPRCNN